MRSRVIPTDASTASELEQQLNQILDELNPSGIEFVAQVDLASGNRALAIFYSEYRKKEEPRRQSCAQCKKNPCEEGIKICSLCKVYQKQYREKKKAEKKTRYP